MLESTPQIRTLRRAVEICGGIPTLARALNVTKGELSHWLDGHAVPPTAIYMLALDLVAGRCYKGPA